MKNNPILAPLPPEQQLWFIKELQRAFQKAVDETLSHTEEPVISQKEILSSMNCIGSKSYLILQEGNPVGGMVLNINKETHRNSLELFFLQPEIHGSGIGFQAWQAAEALYQDTIIWETHTPYFEQRNIHFYVNKCGFHIVEFFCSHHPAPHNADLPPEAEEGFFRFEKRMRP